MPYHPENAVAGWTIARLFAVYVHLLQANHNAPDAALNRV